MTAQFTGSHADAASKRGRSSALHTSFTPSRSLSSSPPPPHLALTSPPLLATPPPLPSSAPPPPNPTNGLPHCGRNVTTLICVAGRKEGDVQWLFLVLLAERAVLCANGFCGCCLTLNSPPTPPQGRASGPYRRPLSPPNKCYSA